MAELSFPNNMSDFKPGGVEKLSDNHLTEMAASRYREIVQLNSSELCYTVWRDQSSQVNSPVFLVLAGTLVLFLSSFEARAQGAVDCLTREGQKNSHFEDRSLFERKLFVTPGNVARYVFLTNAPNDGDRSAAVYRMPRKKGYLPGNYWITATVASDSIGEKNVHGITVKRYDAALPATTAAALNELWLAILDRTRIEDVVVCSPTGIFSASTESGAHFEAVTVSLAENSPCSALMQIGADLISYPQMQESKRVEAARKIEKAARNVLKRVTRSAGPPNRGRSGDSEGVRP